MTYNVYKKRHKDNQPIRGGKFEYYGGISTFHRIQGALNKQRRALGIKVSTGVANIRMHYNIAGRRCQHCGLHDSKFYRLTGAFTPTGDILILCLRCQSQYLSNTCYNNKNGAYV